MDLRRFGPVPYAWAGIAAVIVMVAAVVICYFSDPSWDYEGGSMCDFGISDIGYVALTFIWGCIISGFLFVVSGLGWYLFDESKYVRYGGLIVSLAGISLMCVGILDKTYDFHQWVTIIFAVIFIIAVAIVSIQDIIDRRFPLLIGLALVGLYGLATLFTYVTPYAMVQIIMVGYVFFWHIVKSVRIIRRSQEQSLPSGQ